MVGLTKTRGVLARAIQHKKTRNGEDADGTGNKEENEMGGTRVRVVAWAIRVDCIGAFLK